MTESQTTAADNADDSGATTITSDLVQTALGDWVFPEINGLTFSHNRATDVIGMYFGDRLHQQDRLYVVVGTDSGRLIDFIRQREPLPRGSRWVFIEPKDLYDRLMAQPDITAQLDEYVHLITVDEWPDLAKLLQLTAYFRIDGVIFERSLAALDSRHPEYDPLSSQLDTELTQERFRVFSRIGHAPFIRAQLANTPNFPMSAEALKGAFEGKTLMILAGGPSLDECIPWIQAHREGLLLLAVSRISKRLLDVGIQPDIVMTVDPHPISLTVSRQMFEFGPETVLVACNHAFPGITNRWPGAVLYTDNLLPWEDDLNPRENAQSRPPTVTHSAAMLADYMGFKNVIFAGLDLCHAPNGQTHASGSSEAASGPLLDYTALAVETNIGTTAYTTPDYFEGIASMESIAKLLNERRVRCLNPSANAVRMKGIEYRPLDQLPIPTQPFDRSALDQVIATQERHEAKSFYDALDERLAEIADEVGKITRLAQLAQESNQAYFHTLNSERQHLHRRRMNAIDRFMRRRLPRGEHMIKEMAARALLATDLPHDFFDLEASQAEGLAARFYQVLQHQAQEVEPIIETARFRIQTRRMERDADTEVETLVARYLEGHEPERAFWLSRHRDCPDDALAPATEQYQHLIDRLLEQDRQRNAEKRAPQASLRLAEMHFSQNNGLALESLWHALAQHPDCEKARPYHAYLGGLLSELNDQPQEALQQYEQVLNQADQQQDLRLIEHCLLRIAAVSLTVTPAQVEQASQALETASLVNPAHWPHLARLAMTLEQPQKAIEALSHYLQHFPGDSRRVAQLADIFAEQGLKEGVAACRELLPFCPATRQPELDAHLTNLLQ